MHGRIRRYTSPDEHAFFARDLPPLVLPPIQYPEVLLRWLLTPGTTPQYSSNFMGTRSSHERWPLVTMELRNEGSLGSSQVLAPYARDININDKVMALYLDHLLPGITQPGTDNNYGSSAMYDVLALQVRPAPFPSLHVTRGPVRFAACFVGQHCDSWLYGINGFQPANAPVKRPWWEISDVGATCRPRERAFVDGRRHSRRGYTMASSWQRPNSWHRERSTAA